MGVGEKMGPGNPSSAPLSPGMANGALQSVLQSIPPQAANVAEDISDYHAPQTSYNFYSTISIAVLLAVVALAIESSAAAILTSAAAATTLLGDLKSRLSGYSIAISSACAVLAAVAFCSRWISNSEPTLKTGPNLSSGLPTLLCHFPKFSTTVCLTPRMAQLVLVLLLCPGASAALTTCASRGVCSTATFTLVLSPC